MILKIKGTAKLSPQLDDLLKLYYGNENPFQQWLKLHCDSQVDTIDVDNYEEFGFMIDDITSAAISRGFVNPVIEFEDLENWLWFKPVEVTANLISDIIEAENDMLLNEFKTWCEDLNYVEEYRNFRHAYQGQYLSLGDFAKDRDFHSIPEKFRFFIKWEAYAEEHYSDDYVYHEDGFVYLTNV